MNAAPNLTANGIFKGIVLKQCKLLLNMLKKEKKVHECQGRIKDDPLHITGGDNVLLTSSELIILLTWHQHAKLPIGLAVEPTLNGAVDLCSKPALCALKRLRTRFESLLNVLIYVLSLG